MGAVLGVFAFLGALFSGRTGEPSRPLYQPLPKCPELLIGHLFDHHSREVLKGTFLKVEDCMHKVVNGCPTNDLIWNKFQGTCECIHGFKKAQKGTTGVAMCNVSPPYPRPEHLKKWKNDPRMKIAVTGKSGSGKSTFVNMLLGEKVALTGSKETTLTINCFPFSKNGFDILVCDLPGGGTSKFPIANYVSDMGLYFFDSILFLSDNRFTEHDKQISESLKHDGVPTFFIRSKMNQAYEAAEYDYEQKCLLCKSQKDYRQYAKAIIKQSLKEHGIKKVYFIGRFSNNKKRSLTLYDHEKLIHDIICQAFRARGFQWSTLPVSLRALYICN